MGAGWPIPQVARVLKCDPMDLHLLLREEPFACAKGDGGGRRRHEG
jgi:hypothetical protein